jgi:hypothetical protein
VQPAATGTPPDGPHPHRVGKPPFGPLARCHGALRGTYRIDENTRTAHVLNIDHRAEIYRSRRSVVTLTAPELNAH